MKKMTTVDQKISDDEAPATSRWYGAIHNTRLMIWGKGLVHKHHVLRGVMVGVGGVILYVHQPFALAVQHKQSLPTPKETQQVSCLFQTQLHLSITDQFTQASTRCQGIAQGQKQQQEREEHFRALLAGYPMASMVPVLAKEDARVAAFIIGIAKIESNWGKRSPWKSGVDCYNYWGYKTTGSRGQALGHACFGSPEEAVATVAKRLNHFVIDQGRDTPQKLLVWKCGRSCASHDPAGVARWVHVVGRYTQQARAVPPQTTKTPDVQLAMRR